MKTIITRIHLWAGLLLGLQVLLWMTSGVVMSWFHIDNVRGAHNIAQPAPVLLGADMPLLPVTEILATAEPAEKVTLSSFLGRPVYRVDHVAGTHLLDAETGEVLSPLTEELALAVARADFSGEGAGAVAELFDGPASEYRGSYPVWRVQMKDDEGTRIYVSPETGRVVARRNATWRIYDFFWMLHIMDYEEREDFNNPLVRVASATGLVFAISGLWLVVLRFRAGRYSRDMALLRSGRRKP